MSGRRPDLPQTGIEVVGFNAMARRIKHQRQSLKQNLPKQIHRRQGQDRVCFQHRKIYNVMVHNFTMVNVISSVHPSSPLCLTLLFSNTFKMPVQNHRHVWALRLCVGCKYSDQAVKACLVPALNVTFAWNKYVKTC